MRSLLALLAFVLCFATAASAIAAEVAYVRLTEGFWQIWVYRVETGKHRQITRGPSDKHAPAWAPDGGLVFRGNDDGLYRVGPNGGSERAFLSDVWPATDPVFAPQGRVVAFAKPRTDVRDVSAIWIVGADGRERRALTRGPGTQVHPTWSRDAAWIAYEHFRGSPGTDLRRVAADGSTNELLLEAKAGEHNQKPELSPDGRWLAYASNRTGDYEIWIADAGAVAEGGRRLTDHPELDTDPAWSPDSGSIAFTRQQQGKLGIWVAPAAGGDARSLFEIDDPAAEPAWR